MSNRNTTFRTRLYIEDEKVLSGEFKTREEAFQAVKDLLNHEGITIEPEEYDGVISDSWFIIREKGVLLDKVYLNCTEVSVYRHPLVLAADLDLLRMRIFNNHPYEPTIEDLNLLNEAAYKIREIYDNLEALEEYIDKGTPIPDYGIDNDNLF
jgi:hypothetical protein